MTAALIGYSRYSKGNTWPKGKVKGRRPKLSPPQRTHVVKLHTVGKHSIADAVGLFEVFRVTEYWVFDHITATAR
ncbi:hypothetical protein [Micromonospora endolithica]|nr:hypothetical protein [Micromonospora endolithica]